MAKMNRRRLIHLAAGALLAPLAMQAHAQGLEIIRLRYRTVDQVLPVLQPLLEPGGTLSGHSGQLFLRASPANADEIKRVLETLDRPSRRLQISVRFDQNTSAASRNLAIGGTLGSQGSRIELSAQDAAGRSNERVDQRLQVVEGGRGVIFAGQSVDAVDRASGFIVVPRLSGGMVQLEVSAQRQAGDSFNQASSTVSGRLGEWFELGGTSSSLSQQGRGIASGARSSGADARGIWVKVEELRN